MADELGAVFSPMLNGIGGGIVWLLVAVVLVGFVALLFMSGLLVHRKYKVHLFMPRSGGDHELGEAWGRMLDKGRFGIKYGMMGKEIEVQAPPENCIHYGNVLYGYSPSKDEIYWIPTLSVDPSHLTAEPTASPALRITYANGVKAINDRFSLPNQLKEYAIVGTLLILGVAIGLGNYFGQQKVADSLHEVSASFGAVSAQLNNATIVIQKAGLASTTTTTPTNPQTQVYYTQPSNPPPGG